MCPWPCVPLFGVFTFVSSDSRSASMASKTVVATGKPSLSAWKILAHASKFNGCLLPLITNHVYALMTAVNHQSCVTCLKFGNVHMSRWSFLLWLLSLVYAVHKLAQDLVWSSPKCTLQANLCALLCNAMPVYGQHGTRRWCFWEETLMLLPLGTQICFRVWHICTRYLPLQQIAVRVSRIYLAIQKQMLVIWAMWYLFTMLLLSGC